MMKWLFLEDCFQRLATLFVFLQSETVVQGKQRHFTVFYMTKASRIFGTILTALARGFSDPPF